MITSTHRRKEGRKEGRKLDYFIFLPVRIYRHSWVIASLGYTTATHQKFRHSLCPASNDTKPKLFSLLVTKPLHARMPSSSLKQGVFVSAVALLDSFTGLAGFSRGSWGFVTPVVFSFLFKCITAKGRQWRGRFEGSPSSSYS